MARLTVGRRCLRMISAASAPEIWSTSTRRVTNASCAGSLHANDGPYAFQLYREDVERPSHSAVSHENRQCNWQIAFTQLLPPRHTKPFAGLLDRHRCLHFDCQEVASDLGLEKFRGWVLSACGNLTCTSVTVSALNVGWGQRNRPHLSKRVDPLQFLGGSTLCQPNRGPP